MNQKIKHRWIVALLVCVALQGQMPPNINPSLNAVNNSLHAQNMMAQSRAKAEAARRIKIHRQQLASGATKSTDSDAIGLPKGEAWRVKWMDEYSFPRLDGDHLLTVKKTSEKPWGSKHFVDIENVICFALKDGKKLWEHLVVGELELAPQLFGELAIYATKDYELVALNRGTGKEQYRLQLDKLKKFFSGGRPSLVQFPILEGDRLFVATYGKGASGDASGKLYAIDLTTGKKLWDQTLESGAGQTPAVMDDLVVVEGEKWIQAIQMRDGKVAWKFNTFGSPVSQTGVAVAGNWCLTAGNMLYALDGKTGEKKWSSKLGNHDDVLGEGDRLVYTERGMFGLGERAIGLDAKTGTKVWETKLDGASAWSAWWLQDGVVLLAKDEETLGMNATDGKVVWRNTIPGKVRSFPTLFGTQVFMAGTASGKSTLHALDLADGKVAWTYIVSEKSGEDSLVADPKGVFFMTKSRNLLCLR